MRTIQIDRMLPIPAAANALHEALKVALGDKFNGIRTGHYGILIDLLDTATLDDDNNARQIALTHDFSKRTTEQSEQATRKNALAAARATADEGKMSQSETIAYLLMEVKHLREQLGQ